jgi:DNA repair protein RecN (Recombination protein N)
MLCRLIIRNFITVTALELEFTSRLTVFSGETGAGKSILVDALALALGARADAVVVRAGCPRADIVAVWTPSEAVRCWLLEQAYDVGQEELLLRRVIDAKGGSRAWINGIPATLGALNALGRMLVSIQGQHAHQQLLHPHAPRVLLDTYAGLVGQTEAVAEAWHAWREATAISQTAEQTNQARHAEREQLAWQLSELDALAPQAGEWENIHAEHNRLSHTASIIEGVRSARNILSEADGAVLDTLGSLAVQLRQLAQIDHRLTEVSTVLETAEIQLGEAAHLLNHLASKLELEPECLAQVEARLSALYSCARTLRVRPECLPTEHAARREQLAAMDAAADLEALHAAAAAAKNHYETLAKQLSTARRAAACTISTAVTARMQTLAMIGGRFEVVLTPLSLGGAHGLEQLELHVSDHADGPLRPLAKVASGGELSRISLALAIVTSASQLTPTLIFDEVDSGIGGATAEVVGRMLHQLAQQHQVLCVTHLPHIAAVGDAHFSVTKTQEGNGQTCSTVTQLDQAGRVEEIARMLGGVIITATTRQHAEEMLANFLFDSLAEDA